MTKKYKNEGQLLGWMIKNLTKKSTVAVGCKVVSSLWGKATGLMFSSRKKVEEKSLVFVFGRSSRVGLHMFFVFYSIDVLFLDENKRVVDIKKGFKPFTLYESGDKAKYVLEVPVGSVELSGTGLGDELCWSE
ncbi:DUF192 domain-containing protein [Nanoarchaeota archaeon]